MATHAFLLRDDIESETQCQGCSKGYYDRPERIFRRGLERKGYFVTDNEADADYFAIQTVKYEGERDLVEVEIYNPDSGETIDRVAREMRSESTDDVHTLIKMITVAPLVYEGIFNGFARRQLSGARKALRDLKDCKPANNASM